MATVIAAISSIPSSCFLRLLSENKVRTSRPPNFSLKSSISDPKTQQIRKGRDENDLLVSLSKQGRLREALERLREADESGVTVNPRTYQVLLDSCRKMKSLVHGRVIHDMMRRNLENPSGFLEICVLEMYLDCGCFSDARKVFDEMPERSLVTWGVVISAYARRGLLDEAFGLFICMLDSGMTPDRPIYTSLLRSLAGDSCVHLGKQVHSHAIRTGLGKNISIESSILNMYIKCGLIDSAELVFDQIHEKDVVAWTGMMVGYTRFHKDSNAIELFGKMGREGINPDEYAFSIILKACAALKAFREGEQAHAYIAKLGLESEVSLGTPLVNFYLKCEKPESAFLAFKRISEPNDVSWSAMISGCYQIGEIEKSVEMFRFLRREGTISNSFIYTTIFQACSMLADFDLGSQVHADAMKRGLVCYLHGDTAITTMYSKCGFLEYALRAFESIEKPDTVAWTAVISGYACHGNGAEALRFLGEMVKSGVKPNRVTFVAILIACSHGGLVEEGRKILESMKSEYNVDPTIDHYDCLVDVYARAGLLDDAYEVIKTMPFEPSVLTWKSLLGGCWTHRNPNLGKIAADNLLELDPDDVSAYVFLFHFRTTSGNFEEAARVRETMEKRNLEKSLNCSWITIKGKLHKFIPGDRNHPRSDEIYSKLRELVASFTRNEETGIKIEEDESSWGDLECKEEVVEHSERLAIAFGLISTASNVPIRVFKDFRGCKYCHEFVKHVSKITGREIVVRDTGRFHHFRSGQCSCNGCW